MTNNTAERVRANGAELYVELRGSGPAVLLVAGAAGDGGQYAGLVAELSTDHTVVTYDRRGNSRSPRPKGWSGTSVDEQADDAAALCDALGLPPAVVYGNSTGAMIALDLMLRHPDRVAAAILHEPALMSVLEQPDEALGAVQPVIGAGMASGGLRGGTDAFLRFAGGPAYDTIDEATRERMLGNGETLFEYEFGSFASWRPDHTALASARTPVIVASATETAPFFVEAANWLATQLGAQPTKVPGGHMAFLDYPAAIADVIRGAQR